MTPKKPTRSKEVNYLDKFLQLNKKIQLSTTNFNDAEEVSSLNWKGIERKRNELIKQLKGYKRLLKLLPSENPEIILALLNDGIVSAVQVAVLPRHKFIVTYSDLFSKNGLDINAFIERAKAVQTRVLLSYMKTKQTL